MNIIEQRRTGLRAYQPEVTRSKEEMEQFWKPQLMKASRKSLNMKREKVDDGLFPHVDIYRISYEGFDDTPIGGWFIIPAERLSKPLPCIVIYQGYTGDRGYPERYAQWILLGYCVFAVDVRGQGGETGNLLTSGKGHAKGWVTQGIVEDKNSYYLAMIIDAYKAVECAASQPETDNTRIVVMGTSQGGGLAMAAAALSDQVYGVVADIPNLCHMDFAVMNSTGSISEVAGLLNRHPDKLDEVLTRLSYFDMMNLAYRITAPIMMSVSWKDTVCPPETIYAAYNQLTCTKSIDDFPFMDHQVPEAHNRTRIDFLKQLFSMS